jgi:hypothetical protein
MYNCCESRFGGSRSFLGAGHASEKRLEGILITYSCGDIRGEERGTKLGSILIGALAVELFLSASSFVRIAAKQSSV